MNRQRNPRGDDQPKRAKAQRGSQADQRHRVSTGWLWVISFIVLVGMWLERFIIVVVSLSRDFLNSSWGQYYPTKWDWMTFAGTIGMFLTAMWLFVRILPMISIFELRTLLPEAHVHEAAEVKQ